MASTYHCLRLLLSAVANGVVGLLLLRSCAAYFCYCCADAYQVLCMVFPSSAAVVVPAFDEKAACCVAIDREGRKGRR